jgi:hypothetical protein
MPTGTGWNARFRNRLRPLEFGAVGSRRQTDPDRMLGTDLGKVVLGKFLAYFVSSYADDGVLAGIEVLRQVEEFHPDGAFLEGAGCPAQRLLDDILEELAAPPAIAKSGTFNQAIELRAHGLRVGFAGLGPLVFPRPLHSA